MAYYENPGMLRVQFDRWLGLPLEIQRNLHVIVVDDGSPKSPAIEVMTSVRYWLASFQLWRMRQDVRWCQDACRNVGAREAQTDWILMTDMDHVIPVGTWTRLMVGELDKSNAYRFGRVSMPDCLPYKHHPNSFAMTRDLFDRVGGYDERFAGLYGTDGLFLTDLKREAQIVDLPEVIIRYPREVIPDASTTTLERKSQADKDRINALRHTRKFIQGWRPLRYQFPCERVL